MKIRVNISAEAYTAILRHASGDFAQTGVRRRDGTWDVPLGEGTIGLLMQNRQGDETLSDVILRIAQGKPS